MVEVKVTGDFYGCGNLTGGKTYLAEHVGGSLYELTDDYGYDIIIRIEGDNTYYGYTYEVIDMEDM